MKHFSIDQWADYSRDVVGEANRTRMQKHLEACPKCRNLSSVTGKLAGACARMQTAEVPEGALRLARAIFQVRAQPRPRRGNRVHVFQGS